VAGDPALALTWLNRAVSARPQDERPALERAQVHLAAERFDAAEADARRALWLHIQKESPPASPETAGEPQE